MQNPSPSPFLVAALRRILRPLTKLMLAQGINLPFVSELMKNVMVEVAITEFPIADKHPTDSRISLLTGVHRKDVRRLRTQDKEEPLTPKRSISLGMQLIAAWVNEVQFLDAEGIPLALPRHNSQAEEVSFEKLVAYISKDISARSLLDELLRLGAVTLDDADRVHLVAEAFIPNKGFDEKIFYFGQSLSDHLATGVNNLLGEQPPMLERSVHYNALSQASVDELTKLSEKLAMQTLKAISRRAMQLEREDAKSNAPKYRINMGTYFYRAPMDAHVEDARVEKTDDKK